jgi:hypothetical protein
MMNITRVRYVGGEDGYVDELIPLERATRTDIRRFMSYQRVDLNESESLMRMMGFSKKRIARELKNEWRLYMRESRNLMIALKRKERTNARA